jgi:hypothetical protein
LKTLTFSAGSRGKSVVEVRAADGALVFRHGSTFEAAKDFREIAGKLGVGESDVLGWFDRFKNGGETMFQVPDADDTTAPKVTIRGRLQRASESREYASFPEALAATGCPPEPLICWQGSAALAADDVDYHGAYKPDAFTLDRLIHGVEPRPAYAWVTHGGGLRLVYFALGGFGADELAAIAALWICNRSPLARVEFKEVTRHPLYPDARGRQCGPVLTFTQTSDAPGFGRLLGTAEVDQAEIDDYLEEHGLEIGQRYPHDCCPIAPNEKGERSPVVVNDRGIYCHRCASVGLAFGRGAPGFVSWEKLTGRWVPSQLRHCIVNLCHWEHAQHVLEEQLGVKGPIAKAMYRAALRRVHGPDPRLDRVFIAGKDLVRIESHWATPRGERYTEALPSLLSQLPAAQYVDKKSGDVKIDPERVARLQQPGLDLTTWGYPSLTPIWGCRIWSHRLSLTEGTISVVLPTATLAPDANASARPKYIPAEQREMTENEAWEELEGVFPALNRNAVKLLICAKGCSEGGTSMPPFIYITGPSGAGKTGIVHIAAAICGDSCHEADRSGTTERIRQQILTAKQFGAFVLFNEFAKETKASGQSFIDGMNFVLNLTPNSLSHQMYVGPVRLGTIPVVGFSDTELPAEIRQDTQLARRLVHVHLPSRVDWEQKIKDNIGSFDRLRVACPKLAMAADVIVSVIQDEYFDVQRSFREIADSLGFPSLENSDDALAMKESLRTFYTLVQAAPEATGRSAERWGPGWKLIHRYAETPLSDMWDYLCDSVHGDGWAASRRCSEVDWRRLLNLPGDTPIKFRTLRPHGKYLPVRFEGVEIEPRPVPADPQPVSWVENIRPLPACVTAN